MTELKAGVDLDFQIAQAVGLEPLGIYTGWAPDDCFSWCEQGDWPRVVINYAKLWPEWTCEHIHEGFEVDKLFHPDSYDLFHRDFFAKFAHYTTCCAPAPEFSIDLNAAIEAAQRVNLFTNSHTSLEYWPNEGYSINYRVPNHQPNFIADTQPTAALAVCAAILDKGKK